MIEEIFSRIFRCCFLLKALVFFLWKKVCSVFYLSLALLVWKKFDKFGKMFRNVSNFPEEYFRFGLCFKRNNEIVPHIN